MEKPRAFARILARLLRLSGILEQSSGVQIEIDAVDLEILDWLQRDATLGQAVIGNRVGLSAAAVNRRITRMTNAGLIVRTTAVLDPELLGHGITLIVQIEVESEQPEALHMTEATFTSDIHIQQCYYVTGEADFILVVTVRSMNEYSELTKKLFFANNNVRKFKTYVVMQRAKVGLTVPLSKE